MARTSTVQFVVWHRRDKKKQWKEEEILRLTTDGILAIKFKNWKFMFQVLQTLFLILNILTHHTYDKRPHAANGVSPELLPIFVICFSFWSLVGINLILVLSIQHSGWKVTHIINLHPVYCSYYVLQLICFNLFINPWLLRSMLFSLHAFIDLFVSYVIYF